MLHIIRQQHLHVELNGSESDGLALQRRLPELCQNWLLPALERTLDRFAPPEGSLYIKRLDIDAGAMSLDRLEHDLVEAAAQALGRALREQTVADELPAAAERASGNARRKTVQQSVSEAFAFFLETGQLPWSFRLAEGRSLEQAVLEAWETAPADGGVAATRTAQRQVLASSAAARERLTRQFTPVLLATLLAQLAPEAATAAEQVLAVLRPAIQPADIRPVERLVWDSAVAKAAKGNFLTTEEIFSDMLRLISQEFRHIADILIYKGEFNSNQLKLKFKQYSGDTEFSKSNEESSKLKHLDRLSDQHDDVHFEKQENIPAVFSDLKPSGTNKFASQENIAVDFVDNDRINAAEKKAGSDRQVAGSSFKQDNTSSASIESSPAQKQPATVAAQSVGDFPDRTERRSELRHRREQSGKACFPAEPSFLPANKLATSGKPFLEQQQPVHLPRRKLPDLAEGIYVSNAGLVLLHPFLPQFFGKLGMVIDKQLLQPERALCLLHFLATGQLVAPEYELPLPKVLCNVPLEMPVEADADLTAAEQDEAVALLKAVISHWDALRSTSPDGLRGTFFVRPGKISLRDADWLLQVEPQTWDILLDQLPWGIGMIQLPWMERMLHVEWR